MNVNNPDADICRETAVFGECGFQVIRFCFVVARVHNITFVSSGPYSIYVCIVCHSVGKVLQFFVSAGY